MLEVMFKADLQGILDGMLRAICTPISEPNSKTSLEAIAKALLEATVV